MKYLTLSESLVQNAERHRSNGDWHLANGRPEYAKGSYRKAERNLARAQPIYVDRMLEPVIDRLAQACAAALLTAD